MERHSFAMEIKKGKKNEYRQILGEIWPDLTAFLDQEKVHNFSIWNCDSLIFGYYETDENNEFSEEKKASIQLSLPELTTPSPGSPTPGENMRLMYHNFGVVRENKELIRHRMFITRLKPDCEEEYKARHDGLVAAREGRIDPVLTATSASGAQADIFSATTRSTPLWRLKKHRKPMKLPLPGKPVSLASWTGSPMTATGSQGQSTLQV